MLEIKPKERLTERVMVVLSEGQHRRLVAAAAAHDLPLSDYVRQVLDNVLPPEEGATDA